MEDHRYWMECAIAAKSRHVSVIFAASHCLNMSLRTSAGRSKIIAKEGANASPFFEAPVLGNRPEKSTYIGEVIPGIMLCAMCLKQNDCCSLLSNEHRILTPSVFAMPPRAQSQSEVNV